MARFLRWSPAVTLALLLGCTPGPTATDDATAKPRIVCTTGMVADLVRQVGGDLVEVEQLMGAGVDPHLYKASTGDVAALNRADAIFYNGLNLEGKMTDVFVRMARRTPTYAVTERLPADSVRDAEGGHHDPHLWFDVALWAGGVAVVRDALVDLLPEHADELTQRAKDYAARLDELDAEVRERVASIPKDQRVLVTAHDAFGYFGQAYDIEVRGIQGISTDSEASVAQVEELVRFLAQRQVKAIFVETSVSDRSVRAVIDGCQARGHDIEIGGELFSDAMGPAGEPTGTYVGMVRHNVDTIVEALK